MDLSKLTLMELAEMSHDAEANNDDLTFMDIDAEIENRGEVWYGLEGARHVSTSNVRRQFWECQQEVHLKRKSQKKGKKK